MFLFKSFALIREVLMEILHALNIGTDSTDFLCNTRPVQFFDLFFDIAKKLSYTNIANRQLEKCQ